jgi:transcriptional regulator with XRE-family HTH domain
MTIIDDQSLAKYQIQISNNLKRLLDIYSMNTLDLSNKLELSYTPIYNLVNGNSNPTLDTLLKIARYFHLSLSQLIGDIPINTSGNTNYLRTIPILKWTEVLNYLYKQDQQQNYKQILISSENPISESAFSLHANEKTEPLFKNGTILVFERIIMDIKNYDNHYVLLQSDVASLNVKKLFVEGNNMFLQSINTHIPPQQLLDNETILGNLIQTRLEFQNSSKFL